MPATSSELPQLIEKFLAHETNLKQIKNDEITFQREFERFFECAMLILELVTSEPNLIASIGLDLCARIYWVSWLFKHGLYSPEHANPYVPKSQHQVWMSYEDIFIDLFLNEPDSIPVLNDDFRFARHIFGSAVLSNTEDPHYFLNIAHLIREYFDSVELSPAQQLMLTDIYLKAGERAIRCRKDESYDDSIGVISNRTIEQNWNIFHQDLIQTSLNMISDSSLDLEGENNPLLGLNLRLNALQRLEWLLKLLDNSEEQQGHFELIIQKYEEIAEMPDRPELRGDVLVSFTQCRRSALFHLAELHFNQNEYELAVSYSERALPLSIREDEFDDMLYIELATIKIIALFKVGEKLENDGQTKEERWRGIDLQRNAEKLKDEIYEEYISEIGDIFIREALDELRRQWRVVKGWD
jgi:hypothetical protein